MNDVLFLYLFTRLDAAIRYLSDLSLALAVLSIVLMSVSAFKSVEAFDDDEKEEAAKTRSKAVKPAIACAVLLGLAAMIPTKSDMAVIVGGKVAIRRQLKEVGK